ncbi:MAG: hypothetical protein ACP5NC_07375 [Nitrososphaeria archaeon]
MNRSKYDVLVVLAIMEGYTAPRDIAAYKHIPVEAVYNSIKRLRRRGILEGHRLKVNYAKVFLTAQRYMKAV